MIDRYRHFDELPDLCRGAAVDRTPTMTTEKRLDDAPHTAKHARVAESTNSQKEN